LAAGCQTGRICHISLLAVVQNLRNRRNLRMLFVVRTGNGEIAAPANESGSQ
jgi:hypothetical protein